MNADDENRTTHFGFTEVPMDEKASMVGAVFSSVADRYDLMNDLMSFGVHRLWKKFACSQSGLKSGGAVLDVAAGSGDLSREFHRQVGDAGMVTMTDVNRDMLARGRDAMIDAGVSGSVRYVLTDAERLAFDDDAFDCVCISFGLRNVTRISRALESMHRVLKPGGKVLVLEFSRPTRASFRRLYDFYSFNVLPAMGRVVASDEASYRYLVESIRKHPDQQTLARMMSRAGFEDVDYFNLSHGIAALHVGYKY